MSKPAVLTPLKPVDIALPKHLAGKLDTGISAEIQNHLQSVLSAELEKQLQDQIQQYQQVLDKQLKQHLQEYEQRLESSFDQKLAEGITNGVAKKVLEIIEQNRLARYKMFGPSSESSQRSLFNESEQINEEDPDHAGNQDLCATQQAAPKKRKVRGHRKALPPELPRVDVVLDIDESKRTDTNGNPMVRIGQEVSEKLDIIPMKIRVIRTIRPKYAPAKGAGSPIIAAMPESILPRSNFSASSLAMLLTVKYADGLPLYRFNKVLKRHGVDVPRQTLARYVIEASKALQPIANIMRDTLFDGSVMHMDETSVQVLKEPGKKATSKSYMWVQYGGLPDKPVVMFDYAPARSSSVPVRLLQGWSGHLMTDDYSGYNELVRQNNIIHLACMAHARRKFIEAKRVAVKGKESKADIAIGYFAKLYRIEKRIKKAPDILRYRVRQKLSRQILDDLRLWVTEMIPIVTPKSKLGEALSYTNSIWPKLMRYIDRGDLPIDNNPCENAIRPFVVGRKAWLFSSTQAGARASALIYSIIETAKANGREPYAWLCYVLERLPLAKNVDEIEALMPWNTTDEDLAMNLLARQEWG